MKTSLMTSPPHRWLASFLLLVNCVGCFRSAGSMPVNESAARVACETFLDAWVEGLSPEDLKPNIHGADYVWASGQKLVSYEILPHETNHGTSLHVSAKLTLKDARGAESKSNASYTVGTYPVVTVIRDEL